MRKNKKMINLNRTVKISMSIKNMIITKIKIITLIIKIILKEIIITEIY
jgi:hypothetical protein